MRYLISLLFLGIAGFMFFTFADPMYKGLTALQNERAELNSDLEGLKELAKLRDELLTQYNGISSSDRERLNKIIPHEVSSDQLMVEINRLASQNGLIFNSISIAQNAQVSSQGRTAEKPASFAGIMESPKVSFKVSGTYSGFRLFLEDLEKHIRITDIEEISFNAAQDTDGFIDLSIIGMSYWER